MDRCGAVASMTKWGTICEVGHLSVAASIATWVAKHEVDLFGCCWLYDHMGKNVRGSIMVLLTVWPHEKRYVRFLPIFMQGFFMENDFSGGHF